MTDINNPTNMRADTIIIDGAETWGVHEDDPELPACGINNYGWLAGGFADEEEAQEWLKEKLLERQCEAWEAHIRQNEDDEECPF